MDIQKKIIEFIDEELKNERLLELKRRLDSEESRASVERFKSNCLPKLRKATPHDYRDWLEWLVSKGGQPTVYHHYNMPDNWYVALSSFELPALFGANSVRIIIPMGINIGLESNNVGHSSLFFYDLAYGIPSYVPVFKNLGF
jgi:hypothetical protein